MSNIAPPQQNPSVDEWDHILRQLEEELPVREQVSAALNEANAAFAAQFTQPDGFKYIEACDCFAKFLDLKLSMDNSEQKLVVQTLQIACAMHENAVNNPTLTEAQRSSHYLACVSLNALCKRALDSSITDGELWCEVFSLSHRAERAFSRAVDALDLSMFLDVDLADLTDDFFAEPVSATGGTSTTSSPAPAESRIVPPKASLNDITEVAPTPRSTKLREQAIAMLEERPSKRAPLGRAKTMPSLSRRISLSYSSRTDGVPSTTCSRGPGLNTLQEEE